MKPSISAIIQSRNLGLFVLASAVLLFEINLIRVFSVSQFYHFAFLVITIVMFGNGAGGTLLASLPAKKWKILSGNSWLFPGALSLATGILMLTSYILFNEFPFDSFRVVQKPSQLLVLGLHIFILSMPFFTSSLVMGFSLLEQPSKAGGIYSANLIGSAAGCAGAFILPLFIGGEGIIIVSSILAVTACLVFTRFQRADFTKKKHLRTGLFLLSLFWIFAILPDLGLRLFQDSGYPFLAINISPYKSLSYALQAPGAMIYSSQWNAYSRVDVVKSPSLHMVPGLSYRFKGMVPNLDGIFVDADNLSPLILNSRESSDYQFTGHLLTSLPYFIQPDADVLVLDASSGIDAVTARILVSGSVTAVEANPLVMQAAARSYQTLPGSNPAIQAIIDNGRSYLRGTHRKYDIIVIPLTDSYHPVRSGTYSLGEEYRYTLEALGDALAKLSEGGMLSINRWLQNPPSESLKTFAMAVTAVEREGGDPKQQIIAVRSFNMITILIKNQPFSNGELETIREFASERAFDLVYLPGLRSDEVNRFNILSEPVYEQQFSKFLNAPARQEFYNQYPFNVRPPSDDQPFFNHYFRWSQAEQVIRELGKIWQPFGGAGYFILLVLLLIAILLSIILVLLPAILNPHAPRDSPSQQAIPLLIFFGCIGMAFMLVEIPLIQQFILYLGNPATAFSTVLFSLLLFSGIGSLVSGRLKHERMTAILLACLISLLCFLPWVVALLVGKTIGFSPGLRLSLTVIFLAPVGFLMGFPFPSGIKRLSIMDPLKNSAWIGWAWAINGSCSVVATVLASFIAISTGFRLVFLLGAFVYAAALIMFIWSLRINRPQPLHP